MYREPIIEKYNKLAGSETAELSANGKASRDPCVRTKNKADEKINERNKKKLDILEEMRADENK